MLIASHFDDFKYSWIEVAEHHEGIYISGTFEDILNTCNKMDGWKLVFRSGIGLIIFIGIDVGSLFSTGSLVPGVRVVGGVLWLAGPEVHSMH